MEFPQDQIDELKAIAPGLQRFDEAGRVYFLMPSLKLPEGCEPQATDALLSPTDRGDGYPSRLFFPARVRSRTERNWNGQDVRIIERNWFAYSWKIGDGPFRLAQMLGLHLKGLQ